MKRRKLFVNEKLDLLYTLIWILLVIILLLLIKLMDFHYELLRSIVFCLTFAVPNLISSRRRRNQIKKIDCLRQILGISINEIRSIAGIGRYDLVDWKWDQAYISPKKMYLLEDALETKYIERFGKTFELKSSLSCADNSIESARK